MDEEDSDGDDAINENVFCVLMIRLSLTFMVEAEKWLHKTLVTTRFFDLPIDRPRTLEMVVDHPDLMLQQGCLGVLWAQGGRLARSKALVHLSRLMLEARKYKWLIICSHGTMPLLVLRCLQKTGSPTSPCIVLDQTTQETSDLKNVMRIGMDAFHMVQNSYLEAQFMTNLLFFLYFPIWVMVPSIFSNFYSKSGVR